MAIAIRSIGGETELQQKRGNAAIGLGNRRRPPPSLSCRKGSRQLNSLEPYKSTPWLAIMTLAVTTALTSTDAATSTDVHQLVALLIAVVSAFAVATRLPPDGPES